MNFRTHKNVMRFCFRAFFFHVSHLCIQTVWLSELVFAVRKNENESKKKRENVTTLNVVLPNRRTCLAYAFHMQCASNRIQAVAGVRTHFPDGPLAWNDPCSFSMHSSTAPWKLLHFHLHVVILWPLRYTFTQNIFIQQIQYGETISTTFYQNFHKIAIFF